jgi:hypothetical protein
MSKVFALNLCEEQRISVLRCSPYIRGVDAPGTRVGQQGKAGWRKKMKSKCGEAPSALQVVTSIDEASLLATGKSGETAELDTLCT